jgi:hypothetical protein
VAIRWTFGTAVQQSWPLAFSAPSNQTINVTGNSTYTMALGPITLTSPLTHIFTSLSINTLPNGAGATVASVTSGLWDNYLNFAGGGKVTVTGNLSQHQWWRGFGYVCQ